MGVEEAMKVKCNDLDGNPMPWVRKKQIVRAMMRAFSFHPATWIKKPNAFSAIRDALFKAKP